MLSKRKKQVIILAVVASLIAAVFAFDLQSYLSLEYIKSRQQDFNQFYTGNTVLSITVFFLIYVLTTALSIPGAAVLTLLAGALFGLLTGTILVSFASTLGATLAFLVSRFLLQETVQKKFAAKLEIINRGVEREGEYYLFTLRLIPVFPFFVINLVMGLTPIRTVKFWIVSQIGMLPGTIVYIFAGTQLAQVDSLKDILSPDLILAFVLLGLFPLLAKKTVGFINRRKKANQGDMQ